MRKIHILLLAVLAVSCQKTVVTGFQDKPVVEAYLYVGESPSVKISKLIAYTSDMVFSSEDVAKLAVTITESPSGKSYTML
ncbi:MAG: hypothetical protein LWW85_09280, partial [Marinilabiliales bacterium]|nr:hypothetical protein [Marinilabiliales bacterium]